MWALGDIGVGLMAWLNLIAILALGGVGIKVIKDYEAQIKTGQPLSFDPTRLGIENANVWLEKNRDSASTGLRPHETFEVH